MQDLNKFRNEMNLSGQNVYVGHRYVPKIFGEWDKSKNYEALSIVTHQGVSYTSRQGVPVGIEIENGDYWVATGNYNTQVENYRSEVKEIKKTLVDVSSSIDETNDNLNRKLYYFNTVEDLKTSDYLVENDSVITFGYHDSDDGGGAKYIITSTKDDLSQHYETLGNGLYAQVVDIDEKGYIDIRWLGAVSDLQGNTGTDVAPYIQKALNIADKRYGTPIKIVGNYYWGTEIISKSGIHLFGEHRNNRLLTGSSNTPELVLKSPSEIYFNPELTNALTITGHGSTSVRGAKSTHLSVEQLYLHSSGQTANFIRCSAFGAPSRPGYTQDTQAHGFNNLFLFDYEQGANAYGTNFYNFSIRGGCNFYLNNKAVNAVGRDNTSPSLGGLNIFDNTIEWQADMSLQLYNLFGYNTIKNNLIEGQPNGVMDISLNRGHVDIIGNYFEQNKGPFRVRGAKGVRVKNITTKMYGNYLLGDDVDYHFEAITIMEMDRIFPRNRIHLGGDVHGSTYVLNDKDLINDVLVKNNVGMQGIISDIPLTQVKQETIKENQAYLQSGTELLPSGLNVKNVPNSFSLVDTYKTLPINQGDYVILNFYKTDGLINIGTYSTGSIGILGYSQGDVLPESGYYTIVLKSTANIDDIGLAVYKNNVSDDVKISDVLITVVPSNEENNKLGDYIGTPIR